MSTPLYISINRKKRNILRARYNEVSAEFTANPAMLHDEIYRRKVEVSALFDVIQGTECNDVDDYMVDLSQRHLILLSIFDTRIARAEANARLAQANDAPAQALPIPLPQSSAASTPATPAISLHPAPSDVDLTGLSSSGDDDNGSITDDVGSENDENEEYDYRSDTEGAAGGQPDGHSGPAPQKISVLEDPLDLSSRPSDTIDRTGSDRGRSVRGRGYSFRTVRSGNQAARGTESSGQDTPPSPRAAPSGHGRSRSGRRDQVNEVTPDNAGLPATNEPQPAPGNAQARPHSPAEALSKHDPSNPRCFGVVKAPPYCLCCLLFKEKYEHRLWECRRFMIMTVEVRRRYAEKWDICRVCTNYGHLWCDAALCERGCSYKHNKCFCPEDATADVEHNRRQFERRSIRPVLRVYGQNAVAPQQQQGTEATIRRRYLRQMAKARRNQK